MPNITICTAVWCDQNPGRGAYAFRYEQDGQRPTHGAFGRRNTTNNRLQLMGLLGALHNIDQRNPQAGRLEILVETSSTYLSNGLESAQEKAQQGRNNHDLWERIAEVAQRHRIQARWVKAGSNIELQHIQQIARDAGNRPSLPPDTGYETTEQETDGRNDRHCPGEDLG